MRLPFAYDCGDPLAYGGTKPEPTTFESARVAILPVPVDRTTSYVPGTRAAPREILLASAHMEVWDEEIILTYRFAQAGADLPPRPDRRRS